MVENKKYTIYVKITNEMVEVWRPVLATKITENSYKIIEDQEIPQDEEWEFEPGSTVLIEKKNESEGVCVMAIKRI